MDRLAFCVVMRNYHAIKKQSLSQMYQAEN